MAVNVLTTKMCLFQVLVTCLLCGTATSIHAHYEIISSNQHALTSDGSLSISFAAGAHNRFRRQSPGESSNSEGVNADTATNAGPSNLPDDSSQPVGSGSATSANTTTTAPTASPTTARPTTPTPKPDVTTTSSDPLLSDPDVVHDYHDYYTSDVISNQLSEYWKELGDIPKHETLSSQHRVAAVIPLKFSFSFYGHPVNNVTVATGGFIYMSPFLHQWLTATQYIAPLMANFDPSMSEESSIYYLSSDDEFVVEWKNVQLKDQADAGKFNFQTVLRRDNSIVFVYKSVPLEVSKILTEEHPVKIGVSDAYYNDTYVPEFKIKRRTIYEYHKVQVPKSSVASGSVIILRPLPTCNTLLSCDTCVIHEGVGFDCRWCNTIGRCSDGLDWYRQHWDREGCQTSGGKCDKKSDFPVAVVVVVILIVCGLLAAGGGWVYYAYTHPTSKSGMWLMEHRPSQIKAKIKFWKNSNDAGAKYKAEADA